MAGEINGQTTLEHPAAGPLTGDEDVTIVQAGNTRKTKLGDIAAIERDHAIEDVVGLQDALNNKADAAAMAAALDGKMDIGAKPYILSFFFTSTPTPDEILMLHVAGADFTISADFAAALESAVGDAPTSSFALDLQNNGETIGTITVSSLGAVTAETVGGTAKPITKGDILKLVAPATADATAANMAFSIIGD